MGNELRPPSIIRVTAGARLHIQVIDPAGESGFRRGGVGIALSKPCTSVILSSELNHINYQRNDPLKDEILKEMSILGMNTEYDFLFMFGVKFQLMLVWVLRQLLELQPESPYLHCSVYQFERKYTASFHWQALLELGCTLS